mgnify:CR=1 FL=1
MTRIRNAQMRGMDKVVTPASKLRARVLEVLKGEGYIRGYAEIEKDGHKHIEIELKYFDGTGVISEIRRVSKPGRRVYSSKNDIPLVRNGLGARGVDFSGVVEREELERLYRESEQAEVRAEQQPVEPLEVALRVGDERLEHLARAAQPEAVLVLTDGGELLEFRRGVP